MFAPRVLLSALFLAAASTVPGQEVTISGIADPDRQNRERATSSSGQFLIYGADGQIRSDFARNTEKIRQELAAVMNLPKGWYFPAVVEVHTKPLQKVERRTLVRVFPIEPKGFRFQLDILYDDDYDASDLRNAMIQLLVLEQMFHPPNRKIINDKIPPWLLAGLEELVIYRRSDIPSDIFASLVESHQIMSVREVLTTQPADLDNSVSKRIYRACAAALVKALLEQGNGPVRFRVFLQDLAVENATVTELLERHFEAMRQDYAGLEKWWALQMATMSQKSAFDFLSVEESEQQLEQTLLIQFENLPEPTDSGNFIRRIPNFREIKRQFDGGRSDYKRGSVRDYPEYANHSQLGEALSQVEDRLTNLQNRVFPLYVPIIQGYKESFALMREGKAREAKELLDLLDQSRARLQVSMTEVTDHMNWYDATQVEEESDVFRSYERALKDIEKLDRRKRTDPITGYLDDFEREFGD